MENEPSAMPPNKRITKAIDIFSLGCLFYYVLSGGVHPFGDRYSREINILKGESDLSYVCPERSVVRNAHLAHDLISRMISHDPSMRPSTGEILNHPYFWSHSRLLNFLQDVSDRLEVEVKDPPCDLLLTLEHNSEEALGGDWTRQIDKILLGNLGKYRKYQGTSVQDLLRAIRNKKHHYSDLPYSARRILGPLPDGFFKYFIQRFPKLFLHVYTFVFNEPSLREDSLLAPYFNETDPLYSTQDI
jgi:serine/threonine-protein kinase/endoribonuclease IRE1